jgi:FAD:protein FMN transferase
MGTTFEAILVGEDRDFLAAAGNEALDEVERLDARLSHYRPESEICGLNRHAAFAPVRMELSVFELLMRAAFLSRITGGAFDCTAGPLVKCWGFFRGEGRMPEPEAVAAAREQVGSHLLEFDVETRSVRFLREGLDVHLGAIGKGYAVDRMAEILRGLGVDAALLHGGTSSIYGMGAPPGEDGWEVGITDPRNRKRRLGVVRLCDRALSTSGDYEQYFEVNGRRYSHVLDPRTGEPARGMWSAAVLADSATDTDALSTAAFVLGATETKAICKQYPELGAILVPDPGPGSDPEVVVLGNVQVTLEDAGQYDQENSN